MYYFPLTPSSLSHLPPPTHPLLFHILPFLTSSPLTHPPLSHLYFNNMNGVPAPFDSLCVSSFLNENNSSKPMVQVP